MLSDGPEKSGNENESDVLVQALFRTSQDAIGVARSGMHCLVNPAYLRLFGHDSEDELLDRPILDLIAPAHRARIAEYVRNRLSGAPQPTRYETRGLRRDGSEFDLEVHVSPYGLGGEVFTLVVLRDVTLSKAAESALRESNAFYQALFEVNTAIKLIIDPVSGEVVNANEAACRFYGYPIDELRRKRVHDINIGERADVFRAMEACRRREKSWFAAKHRLASGELRDVEIFSGPVDLQGRQLLLSIIHDVTERRQLEDRLLHSQKLEAAGQLAGGLAHDFNNLLTAMLAYSELICEDPSAGERARRNATQVVNSVLKAQELTHQLLAFSRRQILQPRKLRLNDVVERLRYLLSRVVGPKISLGVDLRADPGEIEVDPGQLEQVIMNLVVNARDAMPAGGDLSLMTRDDGDWVVLAVADTGVGMSPDLQQRIFDPFFTTKAQNNGTGLGLSAVYGIVSQSGGLISVESEPGKGSSFVLRFPRASATREPSTREPEPCAETLPGLRGKRVLLVEDDGVVREVVRESLRSAGAEVLEARNGLEALKAIESSVVSPDLVITDVIMPEMDGIALCDTLRAKDPSTKVLFISAYAGGMLKEDRLKRGDSAFIQKPFKRAELLRRAAELIGEGVR